jgi:cyclin H
MKLNEDDLYRTSTQFRQWSFTAEQLAAQRAKTNLQATERVKLNVARQRAQRAQAMEFDSTSGNSGIETGANTPNAVTSDKEVDCFTVTEELAFLEEFCERTMALGQYCKFSDSAVATCIQFLRRFYLYNSPMTYHAQNISRTAMFLAGKSESEHQSLDDFAQRISSEDKSHARADPSARISDCAGIALQLRCQASIQSAQRWYARLDDHGQWEIRRTESQSIQDCCGSELRAASTTT